MDMQTKAQYWEKQNIKPYTGVCPKYLVSFKNKYVNVMGLLFPQIFEALLMKDTSLLGNRSG